MKRGPPANLLQYQHYGFDLSPLQPRQVRPLNLGMVGQELL